ncbi:MAG: hypothetical protein WC246_01805 [Candidatus Paceibacterota bacterium]|jgi:hypothetical protein
MGETLSYVLLLIVAVIGVFFGLGGGMSAIMPSGNSGGGLFASAFAMVETNFGADITQGMFLVSFDNFKNVYTTILDKSQPTKIFDVDGYVPQNLFYVATDHGLFLSNDGALTFNRFITSNNEINATAVVYRVVPFSNRGKDYFISVYNNGVGTVYSTNDYFFHLTKVVDFTGEAAYDIVASGNTLYIALSNGQLIHYNRTTQEMRVVEAFPSPIVKIQQGPDGTFYVMLKSGSVKTASALEGPFADLHTPSGGGFLAFLFPFMSSPVAHLDFDAAGHLYALNNQGVWKSVDKGIHWELLKTIPIQTKTIDTVAVHNGVVYVVSGSRMYVSRDFGRNWKIQDLQNQFKIANIFFVQDRIIMGM